VSATSNPAEVSAALSISATSATGQEAGQALQAPASGSNLQQGEQVASAAHLASAQSSPSSSTESISSATVSTGSQAAMASVATVSAEQAKSAQIDATRNASQLNAKSAAVSDNLKPGGTQADAVLVNQASPQAGSQVDVDPSLTLNSEASSAIANVSSAAAANEASLKTASSVDSTAAASVNSSSAAQSLTDSKLATEKTTVSSDTQAQAQASQAQESAFNFDAKLAKTDAQQNPKVLETAVSLAGVAKSNAQLQQASLTSNGMALGGQAGATTGAILANAMFSHPLIEISTRVRSGGNQYLGEIVATAGLILIINLMIHQEKLTLIPVTVASWIGSAYFFTSSTSFANPAVTIGRAFSDSFAGIAPECVLKFIAAQLLGALIGLGLTKVLTNDK
jgi:hypothetical protein